MAKFMRTTINADRTIDILEYGQGHTIVALHCTGGNAGQWKNIARHVGNELRIVAPNFVGVGRTEEASNDSHQRLEADIAVVQTVINEQPGPVHLMGHSYGGHIALNIATRLQESPKSLILIEPAVPGGNSEDRFKINTTSVQSTVRDLVEFFDRTGTDGGWSSIPEARRAKLVADRSSLAAQINAIVETHLPDVRQIGGRMPCLIISGADTSLEIDEHCHRLFQMIDGAERVLVPGAGHMLPITHAKQVAESLLAHLKKVDPLLPA